MNTFVKNSGAQQKSESLFVKLNRISLDPDPLACLAGIILSTTTSAVTVNVPQISSIIAIVCALIALVCSAFASASETAFFSLSSMQREEIDEQCAGSSMHKLLGIPEKLLATILITNNLVNVTIVVLSSYAMSQIFTFHSAVWGFIAQSVILTFLILLFGEILPKLYSANHNMTFAKFAAPVLVVLCKLFSPLSRILMKSTFIVNKMVQNHGDDISTEDLSQALEITHVGGGDEKEMLEGILRFGDTTVTEVMRPRVDIEALEYDMKFDTVVNKIISSGYSRMPVYEDGNPDNIKGILYSKDLLPYLGDEDPEFEWQKLLREVYYIPETRMIDDLLEDFRKKKIHMAVVVDEYGCTQGIVTLEDVIEEIVGDINDEYDTEETFYKRLPDNSYIFDGKTLLNDFYKVIGVEEAEFDDISSEVETLAGLLLEIKGDFPKEKESIVYKNCRFLVLDVDKYRIASVRVKVVDAAENTDEK